MNIQSILNTGVINEKFLKIRIILYVENKNIPHNLIVIQNGISLHIANSAARNKSFHYAKCKLGIFVS